MGYTPPYLEVRKIAGGWSVFPPDLTTTDDFKIFANGTDAYPFILLNGGADVYIDSTAVYLKNAGTTQLVMYPSGTDYKLLSNVANQDFYLATTGTGVIKFGTYTAGAATDSTGYITIKDAAGNTRKLMVQA